MPVPTPPPAQTIEEFIARWSISGASERSNTVLFLTEFCDLLGVPRPDPHTGYEQRAAYVAERSVYRTKADGEETANFIDLYKRGSFVLEAKQGSNAPDAAEIEAKELGVAKGKRRAGTARRGTRGWDTAMLAAKAQAERYIRSLPAEEGNPPFIIVADIGHSFDLFADFSRAGKTYLPFPDAHSNRITLADLARPETRELLGAIWLDPMSLDPSRRSATVTRDVADRLARLAKSLEGSGHEPALVASFLMRAIFTMFAEDVGLLPERGFVELLESLRGAELANFQPMISGLWSTMATGGFSQIIRRNILRFNGGLFEDATALPITEAQLELLIEAARADWHDVEPAIFGTLLERALDPRERHKLGAHFTPRAYVERLVMPTIIEPMREEWEATKVAAIALHNAGKQDNAIAELQAFHRKLCSTRVLDPACGTGNFLYVTLEHLKRLEGEVLKMLEDVGFADRSIDFSELTVDPHQLLGIEINPRAAAIADLVLWIGYLQWHFRTHGDALPREPVLRKFNNIECRDALLEYDRVEPVTDAQGKPVTRWDGHTMKVHPVTGQEVPDETARVPVYQYINPRKAEWPEAEFIVGNPPFLGSQRLRSALGDGYTEALWATYPDIPQSADLVMYWWAKASELTRDHSVTRFGLITTNSVTQPFNRRVLEQQLRGVPAINIVYAIPDHPWIDSVDGAQVRIAMSVGIAEDRRLTDVGRLDVIAREISRTDGMSELTIESKCGQIGANFRVDADVTVAVKLKANLNLSSEGIKPHGMGFVLTHAQAESLGLGTDEGLDRHVRRYVNGRDLTQSSREAWIIDLHGLSQNDVRARFPKIYQWVLERVKPEREQNSEAYRRENWWLFGRKNTELRDAIASLPRYIATVKTAKHRVFVFLSTDILPDSKVIAVALSDAYSLGVLSSKIHVIWALISGSRLGVGNDPTYVKTICFETFPFPDPTPEQKHRIRDLGEQLDAHRKRQQAVHPDLTITEMYNVLEKLRSGEALSDKEKKIHEKGLISILKQLHDDLDAAVFEAYGWPSTLADREILERLVALNSERAREEAAGFIRWLRPEFQAPKGAPGTEQQIEEFVAQAKTPKKAAAAKGDRAPWPASLKEQVQAVRAALTGIATPATPEVLAAGFKGAQKKRVAEVLETLVELGQVREVEAGHFGI